MVISPLDRKLLRDLAGMKGQLLAVSIVMACGLAMMIMARSLIYSLESTRDAYYARNRFAHVFADLKRAPNDLRAELAELPGHQPQVVVVDPDEGALGRLARRLLGEQPVDGDVVVPVVLAELGAVGEREDDRPERLLREALIEQAHVVGGERDAGRAQAGIALRVDGDVGLEVVGLA